MPLAGTWHPSPQAARGGRPPCDGPACQGSRRARLLAGGTGLPAPGLADRHRAHPLMCPTSGSTQGNPSSSVPLMKQREAVGFQLSGGRAVGVCL